MKLAYAPGRKPGAEQEGNKMDSNQIYANAAELLGNLTEAEQTVLLQYCNAAAAQCRARLRSDVEEAGAATVLEQACAMLAAALFLDAGEHGEIQSFTAGKLSVTTRSGNRAQRLQQCAETLLAPYSAGHFAFLGVQA